MLTHVSALHGFSQLIKGLFKVKILYPLKFKKSGICTISTLKEAILKNIAKKLGRKLYWIENVVTLK